MKKKEKEIKQIIDEKESKKSFQIIIYIIIGIISLVGIFFVSTYIRWKDDIKDKNEILYYNQEDIKINSLKDFYGSNIDVELNDNEAILMYCSGKYGGDCVTGDFSNQLENIFRKPYLIVNIIIFIILLLVYFILKDRNLGSVKMYVISTIILLYGCYGIGVQIYKYADYYKLVNDTEYLTNGVIYKGLKTDNSNIFKPVVSYEIEEKNYILYVDYDISGDIDSRINEKITLYYDKKDYENITPKRNFYGYILPLIVAFLDVILGIVYMSIAKEKK